LSKKHKNEKNGQRLLKTKKYYDKIVHLVLYREATQIYIKLHFSTGFDNMGSKMLSKRKFLSNRCLSKTTSLHLCSHEQDCEERMNLPAIEVAKYLIRLYFQSSIRYHCTLTKIEKLMFIAELVCLKNDASLFSEDILDKNCGVGIDGLELELPNEILNIREQNQDNDTGETDIPIGDVTFCGNSVPDLFQIGADISFEPSVERLLVDVFRYFGNYKARTLGSQIDELKPYIIRTLDPLTQNKSIDRSIIKTGFDTIPVSKLENNEIYIFAKNIKEL